jgi:hypothetical protein
MGVFMKNMRKCTKEISHNLGTADLGKALIVYIAAVLRAPEFGPEFHDVIAMQ